MPDQSGSQPGPPAGALILDYPFRGSWRVENSPARRVPSHGTWRFGLAYAIDFVRVDERGVSAPVTWRSRLATEPPERYLGFGSPILAPVAGTVVWATDGVVDHHGRRSALTLIPYALGQAGRVRGGRRALAGNHVMIQPEPDGPVVLLAHLRNGSLRVGAGDRVGVGDQVAECGNSGNSTEPHLHLQVTTSADWERAEAVPLAFREPDGVRIPGEREIVTV